MKNLFPTFAAVAVVAALCLTGQLVQKANAGDQLTCQLTSSDAGPTNICALPPQSPGAYTAAGSVGQQFDIWCQIPSVFKTDTLVSGVVGDGGISTTWDVPAYTSNASSQANGNANPCGGLGSVPRCRFTGGKHTGIWALAADGGNPNCAVSTVIGGG